MQDHRVFCPVERDSSFTTTGSDNDHAGRLASAAYAETPRHSINRQRSGKTKIRFVLFMTNFPFISRRDPEASIFDLSEPCQALCESCIQHFSLDCPA